MIGYIWYCVGQFAIVGLAGFFLYKLTRAPYELRLFAPRLLAPQGKVAHQKASKRKAPRATQIESFVVYAFYLLLLASVIQFVSHECVQSYASGVRQKAYTAGELFGLELFLGGISVYWTYQAWSGAYIKRSLSGGQTLIRVLCRLGTVWYAASIWIAIVLLYTAQIDNSASRAETSEVRGMILPYWLLISTGLLIGASLGFAFTFNPCRDGVRLRRVLFGRNWKPEVRLNWLLRGGPGKSSNSPQS